ncbi:MAG: hypothetical protein PHF00_04315, partial [Elusimicrobia bacterium]|nr:hypothetical protein [Elusimicrobiota bacterium]
MAKVLVKLYSALRQRLGRPQLWVEAETAEQALAAVAKAGGPEAKRLLYDEAVAVRNEFVLSLDSEILDRATLASARLKPGGVLP